MAIAIPVGGNTAELARWLRTAAAVDVLDDAVLGCLSLYVVLELLEDYEIPDTPAARKWFAVELDKALGEGC